MLVVAVAGVTRLYLMQRRERTQLETIDGFRSNLETLSSQVTPKRATAPERARAARRRVESQRRERVVSARAERVPVERRDRMVRGAPRSRPGAYRHTQLDPQRRAAAKRRLEARRRGSLRVPG